MFTRLTIYVLLALVPLPFGSARPGWQWLWVLMVGLLALGHTFLARKYSRISLPPAIKVAFGLMSAFIAWGLFQASPLFEVVGSMASLPIDAQLPDMVGNRMHGDPAMAVTMYFLAHLLFFYLVFRYCTDADKAIKLLRFCGIVAFLYAAYGFIIYVMGNDYVLWYEKAGNPGTRSLTGTFINRNNFAAFLGIGLQCLVAYAYLYFRQSFRSQGLTGRHLYRYIIETVVSRAWWLGLGILLIATALLLTQSRGGVASVSAATFLLMILAKRRGTRGGFRVRTLASYGAMLLFAVGLFALSGDNLESRLTSDTGMNDRFVMYPLVVDAIVDAPLTGTGLGTFSEVFATYRTEEVSPFFLRAHSDYLELALTAGIPAAILVFIACLMPAVYLLRNLGSSDEHRCFIALGVSVSMQIGLHSLIDFPLQVPAISYFTCAVLAATVAVAARTNKMAAQTPA